MVEPGAPVPPLAGGWPRFLVDEAALAAPDDTVAALDRMWRERQSSVVELAVPLGELKQPEVCDDPPFDLDVGFELRRERLHFLVWANRYDGRNGTPRWHHITRAVRLGTTAAPDDAAGDVVLPDGELAWIDGGPRGPLGGDESSGNVLHVNQLWAGSLQPDRSMAVSPDGLAPDQLLAVGHDGGAARVLAPAGSGKTRVLTERLRHLLIDRGWAPGTVMALAYNKRAAEEMRTRTSEVGGAQVHTMHAFGYEILGRANGARPRLLDDRAVRGLLEDLAPVRHRANEDVYAPYLEALAEVRSCLLPPEIVEAQRDDVPEFARVCAEYRQRLAGMGAIDFDEQVYGALEVVLRRPDVRQWAQHRCHHVLLDELQDVTPAQLLLVRLLAAPAYDVYGVGDDDQVIYGYAGANPAFLVDYTQFFPAASSYLLEVNYRCPPEVVDAATQLLSYNHFRVEKKIRSANEPAEAAATGLRVEQHGESHLGARLVELVSELLASDVDPDDIAVLTRVNSGLLAPQVLLGESGVPVERPVDERMLDRTGTHAALVWLRLACTAAAGRLLDGRDLATVARRPSRSLRPGIVNALGRGTWPLSRLAGFAAAMDDERQSERLGGLHEDLLRLAGRVESGADTPTLLRDVRDTVGLAGALNRLDSSRNASSSTHVDDLDALLLVAQTHPDPADFEPWLRTTLIARSSRTSPPRSAGQVTLSTVHRVKGLEWPHVIIWDASEGVMPHRLSSTSEAAEEERRVFHVALTRARKTATVLGRSDRVSAFLTELTGEAPRSARPTAPVVSSGKDRRPARRNASDSEPLDEAATELFDSLREWRRRRATADGIPAFVVLHDKYLKALARRAPGDLDALAACDGIGPTKLDRYGDEILAVVNGE